MDGRKGYRGYSKQTIKRIHQKWRTRRNRSGDKRAKGNESLRTGQRVVYGSDIGGTTSD